MRQIAIVPIHGVGVRKNSSIPGDMAELMAQELRSAGETVRVEDFHEPMSRERSDLDGFNFADLPPSFPRLFAPGAIVDVRAPIWTDGLPPKRFSEVASWIREITKLMPGQRRQSGMAKAGADNIITVALLSAAAVLIWGALVILFQIMAQPTLPAQLQFIAMSLSIVAICEIIVTALTERLILRNRAKINQVWKSFSRSSLADAFNATLESYSGISVSPRTTWKWVVIFLASILCSLLLANYFKISTPATSSFEWLLVLVLGRRIFPLLLIVRRGLADIVAYGQGTAETDAIRRCVALHIVDLLRRKREDGGPLYDELHIVGHSMGSVIAFEALYDVWRVCNQAMLIDCGFERIRTFTSVGTGLVKMYAHVRSEKILSDDADAIRRYTFAMGRLRAFSSPSDLNAIRWQNIYYLWDPVADAIAAPLNCEDLHLPTISPDSHRAYFRDPCVIRVLLRTFGFATIRPLCHQIRPIELLQRWITQHLNVTISTSLLRATIGLTSFVAGLFILLVLLAISAIRHPSFALIALCVFFCGMYGLMTVIDDTSLPPSIAVCV